MLIFDIHTKMNGGRQDNDPLYRAVKQNVDVHLYIGDEIINEREIKHYHIDKIHNDINAIYYKDHNKYLLLMNRFNQLKARIYAANMAIRYIKNNRSSWNPNRNSSAITDMVNYITAVQVMYDELKKLFNNTAITDTWSLGSLNKFTEISPFTKTKIIVAKANWTGIQ